MPPGSGLSDAELMGAPAPWDPEIDDTLICRAVRRETHDVKTFVFAPPAPRRFCFRPGQFLTFAFDVAGQAVQRCYTIASPPTRPDTVSITVKRVPGGPVSGWLHDTMRPGMAVRALGPMGAFTAFDHPAEPYLFLSGGSGITPLMSMTRAVHDLGVDRDIVFLHAARTPADIIFRDELAMMARATPRLRLVTLCEADAPAEAWAGHRGRLSPALLALAVPDALDRTIFVCGPAPFMAAARSMLAAAGFDMARHHEESFDFGALPAEEARDARDAGATLATHSFRIEFVKTKRVIDCPADITVLEAARRAGLRLPSSCTKGVCGTCKSRLLSGTVTMTHGGGIRQREIDAGLTLLCCARPTSDLSVDR